jgi:hypothetical protein
MRKILLLTFVVLLVAGCVQEQPTGKFLAAQNSSLLCSSSWNCTEWSACVRNDSYTGVQSRSCTGANMCSDIPKPQESRICGLAHIALKKTGQMAIESSDFVQDKNDWILMINKTLSKEDVSQLESDNGFEKGYYVRYYNNKTSDNPELYQYIKVFPLVNSQINTIYSFQAAKEYYSIGSFYNSNKKMKIISVTELNDSLIGEFSVAYNITTVEELGDMKYVYVICFTKWDVAEELTLIGSNISYEFLKQIGKKAEEKIG